MCTCPLYRLGACPIQSRLWHSYMWSPAKKFVKRKMSTACFEPWTSGLTAGCVDNMSVWAVVLTGM